MIKSTWSWVILLFIAANASAQSEEATPTRSWKFNSVGINYGVIHDRYKEMSLDMMYDFTKNPALLDRNLTGLQEDLYRTSDGLRMGLQATLRYQSPNASLGHEIRLGGYYSGREPLISYNNGFNAIDEPMGEEIIYCNVVNEYGLDATYIVRKPLGARKIVNVYTGAGVSLGGSFNSQLVVMERSYDDTGFMTSDTDSFYGAKSSLFSRIQVPVGIQFVVANTVNINIETGLGVGMQSVFGGNSYFIPSALGYRFGLSYVL